MTVDRRRVLAGIAAFAASPALAQSNQGGVLVFGATGALGAEIVKDLIKGGNKVTAFVRPTSNRDLLKGLDVTYVTGDLFNRDDVVKAFKSGNLRAAITALRVEDNDLAFYDKAMTNIVAGAKAAGIKQIIHSSAVGAGDNAKQFANLGWEKVPNLLDRMKDQGVGEEKLKASGIPYTIVRNSRIWPANTPATGKATLTEDNTVLDAMTRVDLSHLTVSCLDNAKCMNKTYHIKDGSLSWPPPRHQ